MSKFNQKATLWVKNGRDVYGKASYASPVIINCRFQSKNELMLNKEGQQVKTQSVIYIGDNTAVGIDDMIYLGESNSSTPHTDASNVISVQSVQSLDNQEQIKKVWI